jgi:GTP-binding protein Era
LDTDQLNHKAGFVNILGNPNVGKSTLMNNLVGEKLAIITSKAQTTRHRIMGIVNSEDFQIVYSDTPGIISPSYKLQEYMMKHVVTAIDDADIILFVTDVKEDFAKNENFVNKLEKAKVPVITLINKIDLSDQDRVKELVAHWEKLLPNSEIIATSAKKGINLDRVFTEIVDQLPYAPPYFPKDQLTDRTERFFVSEIIREKILINYRQEIPYVVEVQVDSFKEGDSITKISAIIYVMKKSQKNIIIGKGGEALKKVGTEARLDIEAFLEKKVYLSLLVKVNKDWKYRERSLKQFGYDR